MKKEVFLQLLNISTFIGVDVSIVEELFSLLNVRKEVVLQYRLKMVLYCFVWRKHVSQINGLCTIYEKEYIFKYKVKAAAYCYFFPNHALLILLKANKIRSCDLNFPII